MCGTPSMEVKGEPVETPFSGGVLGYRNKPMAGV